MHVSLHELSLDLRTPLRTGRGELRARQGFRVALREGELAGLGEATPPEEFGHDSVAVAERALRETLPALSVATAPRSLPDVRELMARLKALDGSAAARHAVELALLDMASHAQGLPLRALLCPDARMRVLVNALLAGDAPVEAAVAAVEQGFGTLKLKVGGRPLEGDTARMRAIRALVGQAPRLRIDPSGSWSEPEAIRALQELAAFDLELCEQPVLDPDALLRVHREVRVPIAADESLALASWRSRFAAGGVDVLVLKPMVLGGVLPALDLAIEAARHGVGAYVTSSIDGEIARAGAANLAAAIPRGPWAHGLATGHLLREPASTAWLSPRDGEISLPDAPGLGLATGASP